MQEKLMNCMFSLFPSIMELKNSFMKIKQDTKVILTWMRDDVVNSLYKFIFYLIQKIIN